MGLVLQNSSREIKYVVRCECKIFVNPRELSHKVKFVDWGPMGVELSLVDGGLTASLSYWLSNGTVLNNHGETVKQSFITNKKFKALCFKVFFKHSTT